MIIVFNFLKFKFFVIFNVNFLNIKFIVLVFIVVIILIILFIINNFINLNFVITIVQNKTLFISKIKKFAINKNFIIIANFNTRIILLKKILINFFLIFVLSIWIIILISTKMSRCLREKFNSWTKSHLIIYIYLYIYIFVFYFLFFLQFYKKFFT